MISSCCQVIPLEILTRFSTIACERGGEVVIVTPTANVEDQATLFMYPEDGVARFYPVTR